MKSARSTLRVAVGLLTMTPLLLFALAAPAIAVPIDNGTSGDGRLDADVAALSLSEGSSS